MARDLDANAAACRRNCWIAAVFFGIAMMGVVQALFDWHWLLSFIVGLIAAGLLGWLLPTYFCIATEAEEEAAAAAAAEAAAEAEVEAAEVIPAEIAANEVIVDHEAAEHLPPDLERVEGEADSRHAPKDLAAKLREASGAKESSAWSGSGSGLKRKPGQESNVGTASYSYTPQESPRSAPEPAPEPAPQAASEPAAEEAPAAPAAPSEPKLEAPNMPEGSGAKPGTAWGGAGEALSRSGASGAVTPSELSESVAEAGAETTPSALAEAVEPEGQHAAERKPDLYEAPPAQVDDLKRIKGIGPGLEKTLNEMGIYRFEQIAAWTEEEIAWVDARLRFKGRIVRDRWIEQAQALASGE